MAGCEVIVKCARCGGEYENPHVTSQEQASDDLDVCGPCEQSIRAEFGYEKGILSAYGP